MNDCKTVTLRTRPLKNRMLSFYLDYYPGYRDKETMKVIRHESLGIYIYANPKNKREQDFNEVMAEKAEAIEQPRYLLRQYGQQRRFVGPLDGLPSDDRNGHRQMPYVRPVARSGHHHPFDCMGLPRCEGIPYRQGLLPRSHRRQQTQGTYQRNQSFHANHSEMRLSPRRTLRSLFTRYKITRLSGKEITLITVCHTKITGGR